MKKVTAALVCTFVLLAFAGCSGNAQKTGDYSLDSRRKILVAQAKERGGKG